MSLCQEEPLPAPVPMPPSPELQANLCSLLSVLFSSHTILSLDEMFILENNPQLSPFVARYSSSVVPPLHALQGPEFPRAASRGHRYKRTVEW